MAALKTARESRSSLQMRVTSVAGAGKTGEARNGIARLSGMSGAMPEALATYLSLARQNHAYPGSPLIAAQLLRNLMRHWLDLKLRLPNVPKSAMQIHRKIYEAIRSHDADAARRLMWEHLYETSALVTQVVAGQAQPS